MRWRAGGTAEHENKKKKHDGQLTPFVEQGGVEQHETGTKFYRMCSNVSDMDFSVDEQGGVENDISAPVPEDFGEAGRKHGGSTSAAQGGSPQPQAVGREPEMEPPWRWMERANIMIAGPRSWSYEDRYYAVLEANRKHRAEKSRCAR